jgi:hypothetical protein
VERHPVLLRLVPVLDELRFDAVVLLANGDRGVRALTVADGLLYAILGPTAPDWSTSVLWRAPTSVLTPGATVAGEIVADGLPPSSEGLIIVGSTVVIVTDGDEGRGPDQPCETPSRQLLLELAPAVDR